MDDRWKREWSGDWNGRGESLVEALEAARRTVPSIALTFDGKLTWNLNGLAANYTEMAEARERLGYSAPPRWAQLRLYKRSPKPDDDVLLFGVEPRSELEVEVRISETQVAVSAAAENPFLGDSMFQAAREIIESHAVTKVPYYLRDNLTPALSSRWTRSVVWIEKHPVLVTLAVGLSGTVVAVVALLAGR